MRKYAGHASLRDGHAFNAIACAKMKALGWKTHLEVTLSRILARKLKKYGDVDVLAWDPDSGRVLIMECKDLQFLKTYGEIAEQLMDFAGGTNRDGKRDDLRKHLDRVELLKSHAAVVARFLGLKGDCQIENHLVFRNPVPMQFADGLLAQCVRHTFDELDRNLCLGSSNRPAARRP